MKAKIYKILKVLDTTSLKIAGILSKKVFKNSYFH